MSEGTWCQRNCHFHPVTHPTCNLNAHKSTPGSAHPASTTGTDGVWRPALIRRPSMMSLPRQRCHALSFRKPVQLESPPFIAPATLPHFPHLYTAPNTFDLCLSLAPLSRLAHTLQTASRYVHTDNTRNRGWCHARASERRIANCFDARVASVRTPAIARRSASLSKTESAPSLSRRSPHCQRITCVVSNTQARVYCEDTSSDIVSTEATFNWKPSLARSLASSPCTVPGKPDSPIYTRSRCWC